MWRSSQIVKENIKHFVSLLYSNEIMTKLFTLLVRLVCCYCATVSWTSSIHGSSHQYFDYYNKYRKHIFWKSMCFASYKDNEYEIWILNKSLQNIWIILDGNFAYYLDHINCGLFWKHFVDRGNENICNFYFSSSILCSFSSSSLIQLIGEHKLYQVFTFILFDCCSKT